MPRTSNVHAWSGILSAAVIVLASSWAIGSPASAAEPAAEPAKVVIFYGKEAALLQQQNHPAQPVLIAGAGDNVVAILFDEDPNTAAALPGEFFSTDPVAGCVGDGPVACCDSKTGMMVLSATYGGQKGWVQMRELCKPPDSVGVNFQPVRAEVSRALNASFGVDSCFMETADDNGNPLVLVNAPSSDSAIWESCFMAVTDAKEALPTLAGAPAQGGALWLTSSIIRRAVLRPNPSIIPAKHKCANPPPPNTQSAAPTGCYTVPNLKTCSRRVAHWYKYNTTMALWVYQATECGPCPSPLPCR